LEVLGSADGFDPGRGRAVAWLYGVGGNVATAMYRQRSRMVQAMRSLLIEIPPNPGQGVVAKNGGPILSFRCDRVPEISVTALDGQGDTVAHGVAVPAPECNTGPTPGPSH